MVPGVPSRWIGLTTPSKGILPGHQGRTPPRPARCSRLRGRLTRATTDLHREARPARAASGASTLHQPLRPLRAGLPLGPSPHDAAPTPSLSQWRSELRRPDGGREGLASFVGARIARNDTVHPAAANDIDFKTRAARGSVCNGLLSSSFVSRSLHLDVIVDIPVPHGWQIRVLKVRVDCTPKIALRGLGATVLEQAVECVKANPHHRSVPLA